MNMHSDNINKQASARPAAEPHDVTDDLCEVHASSGTLVAVLAHIRSLSMDVIYGEIPDSVGINTIQSLLEMSMSWAEKLDSQIGEVASNEMQRQAERRQAKAVSA